MYEMQANTPIMEKSLTTPSLAANFEKDANMTFENIKAGDRSFFHKLRPGFTRNSTRIDFTNTIMFESAAFDKIITRQVELNDQIT